MQPKNTPAPKGPAVRKTVLQIRSLVEIQRDRQFENTQMRRRELKKTKKQYS